MDKNILIKQKDDIEPKGLVTIRKYVGGTLDKVINARKSIKNRRDLWAKRAKEKNRRAQIFIDKLLSENLLETIQPNLIMEGTNTGKDLIIQRLLSINTYTLNINYGGIGTGTNAPATSDTQLQTETDRVLVAFSQEVGHNQAQLQFFFTDSILANGTYYEFGMFIDATATPNSGQLFNRALFGTPYVKTAGTDTTVQCDVTLT